MKLMKTVTAFLPAAAVVILGHTATSHAYPADNDARPVNRCGITYPLDRDYHEYVNLRTGCVKFTLPITSADLTRQFGMDLFAIYDEGIPRPPGVTGRDPHIETLGKFWRTNYDAEVWQPASADMKCNDAGNRCVAWVLLPEQGLRMFIRIPGKTGDFLVPHDGYDNGKTKEDTWLPLNHDGHVGDDTPMFPSYAPGLHLVPRRAEGKRYWTLHDYNGVVHTFMPMKRALADAANVRYVLTKKQAWDGPGDAGVELARGVIHIARDAEGKIEHVTSRHYKHAADDWLRYKFDYYAADDTANGAGRLKQIVDEVNGGRVADNNAGRIYKFMHVEGGPGSAGEKNLANFSFPRTNGTGDDYVIGFGWGPASRTGTIVDRHFIKNLGLPNGLIYTYNRREDGIRVSTITTEQRTVYSNRTLSQSTLVMPICPDTGDGYTTVLTFGHDDQVVRHYHPVYGTLTYLSDKLKNRARYTLNIGDTKRGAPGYALPRVVDSCQDSASTSCLSAITVNKGVDIDWGPQASSVTAYADRAVIKKITRKADSKVLYEVLEVDTNNTHTTTSFVERWRDATGGEKIYRVDRINRPTEVRTDGFMVATYRRVLCGTNAANAWAGGPTSTVTADNRYCPAQDQEFAYQPTNELGTLERANRRLARHPTDENSTLPRWREVIISGREDNQRVVEIHTFHSDGGLQLGVHVGWRGHIQKYWVDEHESGHPVAERLGLMNRAIESQLDAGYNATQVAELRMDTGTSLTAMTNTFSPGGVLLTSTAGNHVTEIHTDWDGSYLGETINGDSERIVMDGPLPMSYISGQSTETSFSGDQVVHSPGLVPVCCTECCTSCGANL